MRRLPEERSHRASRSGDSSVGNARLNRAHSRWEVRSLIFHSAAYCAQDATLDNGWRVRGR
jgi:hypothetical protein